MTLLTSKYKEYKMCTIFKVSKDIDEVLNSTQNLNQKEFNDMISQFKFEEKQKQKKNERIEPVKHLNKKWEQNLKEMKETTSTRFHEAEIRLESRLHEKDEKLNERKQTKLRRINEQKILRQEQFRSSTQKLNKNIVEAQQHQEQDRKGLHEDINRRRKIN